MDKKLFRSVTEQRQERASHCSRFAFMRCDDGSSVNVRDYDLESLFADEFEEADDDLLL